MSCDPELAHLIHHGPESGPMENYQQHYSRFLAAHERELHFACHSHHYWPDRTFEAHQQYWLDSCKYVDDKWEYFFSQKIPAAQALIAENLHLSRPEQVVFAPNTHELVFRLISSFDLTKPLRILTTDSEFYSFDRQISRFEESPLVQVSRLPTEPFETFEERLVTELKKQTWDMIYVSHVFFNSGWVCDFHKLVNAADNSTLFVLDGYHGFMAIPTNLSQNQDKLIYLAGGYKYAQGGEGCCFAVLPEALRLRPLNTGWFAELSELSNRSGKIAYPANAMQLAGATMDFSGLYRLEASLRLFADLGLGVAKIHNHVQKHQNMFLQEIESLNDPWINHKNLVVKEPLRRGHFLAFEMGSPDRANQYVSNLRQNGIITDTRGSRLRFGFGLTHFGPYGLKDRWPQG